MLGTQATVSREYTRALIREFGYGCDVKLIGATQLAGYAEAELNGMPAPDNAIAAEIAPCFIDADNRRTDTVVLACTHYPLLLPRLRALAPWPVDWIDPAPAIARRLVELIGPNSGATGHTGANDFHIGPTSFPSTGENSVSVRISRQSLIHGALGALRRFDTPGRSP